MKKLSGVPLKAWTQEYNRANKASIDQVTVVRWLNYGMLDGYKQSRCLKCGSPVDILSVNGVSFTDALESTLCPYCQSNGSGTRTRGSWMITTPVKSAKRHVEQMRPLKRRPRGAPRKEKIDGK